MTILTIKKVGDINGRFKVAKYQRGYRWGSLDVKSLLDDIWAKREASQYSLQPIIVKRGADAEWELVDGQQRLTTLYLVYKFMQPNDPQHRGPAYSITYETRPRSEHYLNALDPNESADNIDFFHFKQAYETIAGWFKAQSAGDRDVVTKFRRCLSETVQVLWYEAPPDINSITLFTRLNVGRIPLNDAELIKALLLSRDGHRIHERAAQWDNIERDLQNPDVWAFVSNARPADSPTRITLLFDTLADRQSAKWLSKDPKPQFHTFKILSREIEEQPASFWEKVVDLHALILGWFECRPCYHKIGYLVSEGTPFAEIVDWAQGETKSGFETKLKKHIKETLQLSPSSLRALTYETEANKKKCGSVLLLMNVETADQSTNPSERYPFRLHREEAWSLEHIHAQNAESLRAESDWRKWLRSHRDALTTVPLKEEAKRDCLVRRVDAELSRERIREEAFKELAREVTVMFTLSEPDGSPSIYSNHSVSNLTLLNRDGNSTLGNSVFDVKRKRIIELDRDGWYIPICTRNVFLKYYSAGGDLQLQFWSPQDSEAYLDAMLSEQSGILRVYLDDE